MKTRELRNIHFKLPMSNRCTPKVENRKGNSCGVSAVDNPHVHVHNIDNKNLLEY